MRWNWLLGIGGATLVLTQGFAPAQLPPFPPPAAPGPCPAPVVPSSPYLPAPVRPGFPAPASPYTPLPAVPSVPLAPGVPPAVGAAPPSTTERPAPTEPTTAPFAGLGVGAGVGASTSLAPTTPAADTAARAPEAGTQVAANYNPNMFGDQLTIGTQNVTLFRPIKLQGQYTDPGGSQTTFPAVANGTRLRFLVTPSTNAYGTRITQDFQSAGNATVGTSPVPLAENPSERNAVLNYARSQIAPDGNLRYLSAESRATLAGLGANLYFINTAYRYEVPTQISVPTVSGSVTVPKISEDNSPLPRDRFIANADYFNNAALFSGGVNVRRFVLGIEKTFLDQWASVEVRVPFASTVSSDILVDGVTSTNRPEFGDISLITKFLLYRSNTFNLAIGCGVNLPTSDDLRVVSLDGTQFVHVANERILLAPYLGFLISPKERFFTQGFVQAQFDTNGNPVELNSDFTGLRFAGKVQEQAFLALDMQVGYWLYISEDRSALLRRLAPFLELHYNTTMGKADSASLEQVSFGDPNRQLDELNMSAGLVTQFGDNFLLMLGAVAPLKMAPNRIFDYQVGIRGTLFFGPTARNRRAAANVSSF